MQRSANGLAIIALSLIFGVVYLSTLLSGVGTGDIAEIQAMSPQLGVCHVPGYAIEVSFGKVFSLLPLGHDIAWRLNLMMAVCGVLGCLALYGAVRRVSGRILPGVVAATLLGFSSIYWSFSVAAEAYVFHGMFLLLAVYTTVRFSFSDRPLWLYATALSLGIGVGGRPSELFILIGFLAAIVGSSTRSVLEPRRIVACVALFVLPFLYSVAFHLARYDTEYPHARDYTFAERVEGNRWEEEWLESSSILDAVKYTLGWSWAEEAAEDDNLKHLGIGVSRYARLLSGAAIIAGDRPPSTLVAQERGFGTSLGLPGVLLALAGVRFFRGRRKWVLLGLGLFLGNLTFYLWHVRWDGMTFTVPGLAGLAFLAGLGAAGPAGAQPSRSWARAGVAIGLSMSAVLLATNYRLVDRSDRGETPFWRDRVPGEKARYFPRDSILILTYWQSTTYRYALHVEAERPDIVIGIYDESDNDQFLAKVRELDRPTFIYSPSIESGETPPELARYGLVMVHAGAGADGLPF